MGKEQLTLDEIIKKTREDGIIWEIDNRYERPRIYKFVLDPKTASSLIISLIDQLGTSQRYGLGMRSKMLEGDRIYYSEFGYRLRDRMPTMNRIEVLKRRIQNRLFGAEHFERLNLFSKAYILDSSAAEAERLVGNDSESPPKNKMVLVIEYSDCIRTDHKPHFTHLMNIFYSAYQKFKIPSGTSPAHSPLQNP